MSKRQERAQFRAELIAVLRRIAASLEREKVMHELANERGDESQGFIHTRGPEEGRPIEDPGERP